MIRGATRSWQGQRDSLVDHVWTNSPELVLETRNIPRGPSDHNVITAKLRLKGVERNKQEQIVRNCKNLDINRLKANLRNIPWEQLYSIKDINEANSWFENHYLEVMNRECPIGVSQPNHKSKQYITPETAALFKQRDSLKEKARISKSVIDWENYKKSRNLCTKEMRKDKDKMRT